MGELRDPCPVKAWDVEASLPGRALAPILVKARTLSTEGGVLTLRGTPDDMGRLVVAYGPGFWIKVTPHEHRWQAVGRQACRCGEPYPREPVAVPLP